MNIAFYKARYGNWQDKSIAIASISKYSHCEIVFSDGICASASSRDGGVRFKRIILDDHWDVFHLNTDIDENKIKYWFSLHEDNLYDWPGAIASVIGINLSTENKKYCSFACAAVLGLESTVTPGGLFSDLKYRGLLKYINR